jgi:hypothetical protein
MSFHGIPEVWWAWLLNTFTVPVVFGLGIIAILVMLYAISLLVDAIRSRW